jgi:hypothetical protein
MNSKQALNLSYIKFGSSNLNKDLCREWSRISSFQNFLLFLISQCLSISDNSALDAEN